MQRYDKIYVPGTDEDANATFKVAEWGDGDEFERGWLEKKENQICMTIEEAKEMWEACSEETWQDARPTTRYEKPDRLPGFEGYLQSKGINI